jgi:CheY-like chemotaxis protein/heme-degrading monooxygenase HmoA
MLERCGYRAQIAENGLEAVEAVSGASFAAVLMDCQMPELDGYAATQEIRRLEHGGRSRVPIIATTASGSSPTRERVLLAAVEGQHHVLGLRMVADVLEGAGFDVLYLGEDVPAESLRMFVARHRPAVVGLGFGIAADVFCLADALFAIRETAPDTRIMLGGRAVPPALCATGYPVVTDTIGVVDVVEGLLTAPPQPLPAVVDRLRSKRARPTGTPELPGDTEAVVEIIAKSAEHAVGIAREHVRRAEIYRSAATPDPGGLGDLRRPADKGPAGSPMYVYTSRLAIPPEQAHELVAALRDRLGLADEADGFVDLQVWQSDRKPGEILIVSRWRHSEAFNAYMTGLAHPASHERVDNHLEQGISLQLLEHLHTYEVLSE